MKICLLSDTYPPDVGGVAVSARRLASGLARAGYTVHVCVRDTMLPPGRVQRENGSDSDPIVHRLGAGAAVTSTRADVQCIVTEQGVADLRGNTLSQRAQALIAIAHPDFRQELERAWRG